MFPLEVYGDFSIRSKATNSVVLGSIWSNFELVCDVMDILVTCKYKKDPIKIKAQECSQHFPIITLLELSVAMETRVPQ